MNQNDKKRLALSSMLDILAKKRTSMTMLRAGMFSTTVPFSFMVVFVPVGGIAFTSLSLVFLSVVSAVLMVAGAYSIVWSIRTLKDCSKKEKALCKADRSLDTLIH